MCILPQFEKSEDEYVTYLIRLFELIRISAFTHVQQAIKVGSPQCFLLSLLVGADPGTPNYRFPFYTLNKCTELIIQ